MTALEAALRRAATHGPFFALAVGQPWLPFDEHTLVRHADRSRTSLQARFGHPVESRVVGALAHLALASRLVSPALVAAAESGVVPDYRPGRLRWMPDAPGPAPLSIDDPVGIEVGDTPAAAVLDAVVGPLALVADVLAPRLAAGLLLGNIASAVASAGRLAPVVAELAAAVLAEPRLRDAGGSTPVGFRRRSCCLYYRLDPRAGLCEDCALVR